MDSGVVFVAEQAAKSTDAAANAPRFVAEGNTLGVSDIRMSDYAFNGNVIPVVAGAHCVLMLAASGVVSLAFCRNALIN